MNFLAPLAAFLPVAACAWAYGGSRADALAVVMPWAALASLAAFVVPQRHPGEKFSSALKRVFRGLVRDPVLWTALAFTAFLAVPLFNVGLCPTCDWQAIDAGAYPYPPFRWLPFCVNVREHAGLFCWFVPAFVVVLAVRHALARSGKRAFYELLVWNAAALALFGFVQLVTGAKAPWWGEGARHVHFFATFGYPNMAGAFFAMNYAFALGLWCFRMGIVENAFEDAAPIPLAHPVLRAHYPVVAVALALFATLATLCRTAIGLVVLLTAGFLLYAVCRVVAARGMCRARRFRSVLVVGCVFLAIFGAVFVYAPPEVGREMRTVSVFGVADRFSGKSECHTRVASAMMRDFPLFGVGGWGYKHFCGCYLSSDEARRMLGQGSVNVHNDYLQFLAEFGLVGGALLVAVLVLLARPSFKVWRELVRKSVAAARSGMGVSSLAVFAVEPPVLWTLLGCAAVLVHAFGDCPLRSAAVLALFFAVLPASAGYLPHVERDDKA